MLRTFGKTDLMNGKDAVAARIRLVDGPLELAWHHCAVTADFLGDFFALHRGASPQAYTETRHSIGYLINELIENAIKFRTPGEILIEGSLERDRFEAKITNEVSAETAARFGELLNELLTRDPGELLIERIEANAADPASGGSGLGLLTLMSDYGARLGWIFGDMPESRGTAGPGTVRLETRAALDLS
jgi:hypothetical protein